MARFAKILLLAVLGGLLLTDIEGLSRFMPGTPAPTGTAIAAEAAGPSIRGVTVTRPVPSVSESLSDVQARSPDLEGPGSRDRHIRRRRIPRSGDPGFLSPQLSLSLSAAAAVSDAPAPMAPALDAPFPNGFVGLGNPAMGDVIPPDTMGAAGPNHLVSLLNSQFGIFNKTGMLVGGSVVSLSAFWSSLDAATDNASVATFDPKILYDTNSGRFVAVTLSAHDGPPSWVMIAMSQTSNPTGTWHKVAIRADLNADGTDNNFWADYPGFGVDQNNIYVTANMFPSAGSFGHSKVWIVSKSEPALNGATAALTWTEIRDPQPRGDSIQPAHTFEPAPAEYFIREDGPDMLRLYSFTGGTTLNDLGPIQVTPFASTSFLPAAPQFGDARGIDTGDTRLLNAVFRNGSLWTTHNVLGSSGKVEVAWYQINPTTGAVVSQGRISDPVRWYYYPSIGVNQNNDVAIGFSGSSVSEFASAYYTAQSSTGPAAGVMQPPSLLKTGVASYYKAGITFGGTETDNRWGDFSATVVDPNDNVTFWTLQEYAESHGIVSEELRSRWGTWWGRFQAPAIASPSLTATEVSMTQVDLTWTMPAGQSQTGFRVERRQLPGGNFSVISPDLGSTVVAYTDNTRTAGTTYSYRVRAFSPVPPDSYSNEVTAVTMSLPPPIASGGGGGGGCSVSNEKIRHDDFSTSATAVLILFLPLFLLGARRKIRLIVFSLIFPKDR